MWFRMLSLVLVGVVASGCLTNRTRDRWSGRDRVSAIGLRLGGDRSLRWVVVSGDQRREGSASYRALRPECSTLSFWLDGEHGLTPLTADAWHWAGIAGEAGVRHAPVDVLPRCEVLLNVESVHTKQDPVLVFRLDGRRSTQVEMPPPRRRGVGAIHPVAALGDTVLLLSFVALAASGVVFLVMVAGGPSWHTWTKTYGLEEHRVPEDEVVGQSPARKVYP